MTLRDDETGIEIYLGYDDDGFPVVSIDTDHDYMDEDGRPTVLVTINGRTVHDMFGKGDADDRELRENH